MSYMLRKIIVIYKEDVEKQKNRKQLMSLIDAKMQMAKEGILAALDYDCDWKVPK